MDLNQYANAIASIESAGSGDYQAVGPATRKGNRAYGRYQVMDFNIGPWTEKYLGQRLTPEQFLANQSAQDAVFRGEFGNYIDRYGNPQDAASAWFTGKPLSEGAGRSDILGTTGAGYVQKFNAALGQPQGGNMQPQGLLGTVSTQGQEPEQLPFFQRPGTADLLDTLAIGFSGMSMRPNQALIQSAQERIKGRRETAQTAQQRNATIDWLRNSGLPNADMLIGAVESNAMSPGQAASTAFQILRTNQAAAADPSVQSSSPLPDLTGTVITMRDGSVRVVTAGGETLTGQAALDFVRESQAKYTEDQRSIYGARRGGALEAEVDFGGAAEAARKGGGLTVERGFEAYDQAAKASAGISTINEAIAALDGGAKAGIIYNMLPNVTEASASLRNAMDRMGLDVISSVTFGALSEAEMNLAMETAVPRNLDAAQLRVWLERKRDAQQKAQEALIAAARYLTQPGNTISGWMDQQQSQRGSAPAQSGAAQPPADLSPEDMKWLED